MSEPAWSAIEEPHAPRGWLDWAMELGVWLLLLGLVTAGFRSVFGFVLPQESRGLLLDNPYQLDGSRLGQKLTNDMPLAPRWAPGGRLGAHLPGDLPGRVAHLGPVLDGRADVGQHLPHAVGDRLEVLAVALAVDLDVQPRLDGRVVRPGGVPAPGRDGRRGHVEHVEQGGRGPPVSYLAQGQHAQVPGSVLGDGLYQRLGG